MIDTREQSRLKLQPGEKGQENDGLYGSKSHVHMPRYQYISLDENKADLAEVWSTELIQQSGMLPDGAVIVADGGFEGEIMLNRVV